MDVIQEADRIKKRIDECKTIEEVNKVADEERENYHKLRNGEGFAPVMAIQIKNLKDYMIKVVLRPS